MTKVKYNGFGIDDTTNARWVRLPFDGANVFITEVPTAVGRGVHRGYSLPIYASDNEELFSCFCIPEDWDGEDCKVRLGGWIDTANTDKNFNLQLSYNNEI